MATSSGKNRKMVATELFSSICEAAQRLRPVLIVLDNTAATFVGDLVNRVNARSWVNLWRALAIEVDAGVLLLDHPSMNGMNSGSGRAGSVDWRNAVRVALHMRFSDDPTEAARGTTKFEVSKCNLGPRGEAIKLEWVDGLLCLEGSGSPLQRLARDAQANSKFLELLADRLRLGRDVGDKPGRNYAPAIFAETEGNGGYSKKAFTLAMERLFKANKITLEPVGPPSANKADHHRGQRGGAMMPPNALRTPNYRVRTPSYLCRIALRPPHSTLRSPSLVTPLEPPKRSEPRGES